ncbi:MAG TPA: hypothetical protein VN238_04230 [Solirubrobacteraceae bacterium]|nr:hypothetical protein [Solirubrobacteraceae bacterium]
MLKRPFAALGAAALLATFASAAPAVAGGGAQDGVRFTPLIPCPTGNGTVSLNTETLVDSLRTVSVRKGINVRTELPENARGRRIGTLNVGVGTGVTPYPLVAPMTGKFQFDLLNTNGIRVVLRTRAATILSIYGLPKGTTSAFVTFEGPGAGVFRQGKRGRWTEVRGSIYRHSAGSVRSTIRQRCV